jgi:hypothetical protein
LLGAILAGLVGIGATLIHFFPDVAEPWLGETPLKTLDGETRPLFMGRDRQGQWKVTDKPPTEGIPYEVKQCPIDANIIPSPKRQNPGGCWTDSSGMPELNPSFTCPSHARRERCPTDTGDSQRDTTHWTGANPVRSLISRPLPDESNQDSDASMGRK